MADERDAAVTALRRLIEAAQALPEPTLALPGCGCPEQSGVAVFGAHHRVPQGKVHWFNGTGWAGLDPVGPLALAELRELARRAAERRDCRRCLGLCLSSTPAPGSWVIESSVGIKRAQVGNWEGLGVYLGSGHVQTVSREQWDAGQAEYMPSYREPYLGSGELRHAIWRLDGAGVNTWSDCSFWEFPNLGAAGTEEFCVH
jgi:hypothetical protein